MTTTFADLQNALDGRLDDLAPAIDIAWENKDYQPTIGTPWMRVQLLPATPVQGSLGDTGYNEQRGVYLINLFYPKGEGRKSAIEKADAVITHFKRGTVMTSNGLSVRVTSAGRNAARQEPDWYQVPVEIAYFATTDN